MGWGSLDSHQEGLEPVQVAFGRVELHRLDRFGPWSELDEPGCEGHVVTVEPGLEPACGRDAVGQIGKATGRQIDGVDDVAESPSRSALSMLAIMLGGV
jgi:hypothetical protein